MYVFRRKFWGIFLVNVLVSSFPPSVSMQNAINKPHLHPVSPWTKRNRSKTEKGKKGTPINPFDKQEVTIFPRKVRRGVSQSTGRKHRKFFTLSFSLFSSLVRVNWAPRPRYFSSQFFLSIQFKPLSISRRAARSAARIFRWVFQELIYVRLYFLCRKGGIGCSVRFQDYFVFFLSMYG